MLLPPGAVRLSGAGIYNEAPHKSLLWTLDESGFAPLGGLQRRLTDFFEETGGIPEGLNIPEFTAGDLDLGVHRDVVEFPLSLAVGLVPRLEVEVTVPLVRGETSFDRYLLTGGNVGFNAEAEYNAALLSEFSTNGGFLGGRILLPTEGSMAGEDLQARVVSLTGGDSLRLPAAELSIGELQTILRNEFGLNPLANTRSELSLGDLEIGARFNFLDTSPDDAYPDESAGFEYRGVVSVSARLPTGASREPVDLFPPAPAGGLAGFSAGVRNDFFAGDRFWLTLRSRYSGLFATEVERRMVEPDRPLAFPQMIHTLRWAPGSTISVDVEPRYRLTEAISLGLHYSLDQRGKSSYEAASPGGTPQDIFGPSVLDSPAVTSQQIGGGVRYSTIGAGLEDGRLPFEIGLNYLKGLGDDNARSAVSLFVVQLSVFHRLWGGS